MVEMSMLLLRSSAPLLNHKKAALGAVVDAGALSSRTATASGWPQLPCCHQLGQGVNAGFIR